MSYLTYENLNFVTVSDFNRCFCVLNWLIVLECKLYWALPWISCVIVCSILRTESKSGPESTYKRIRKRISWYLVHLETSLTYRPSKKWVRDLLSSLTQYGCVLSGSDLFIKNCALLFCLLMYANERTTNISLKCIRICFDECEVHLSIQ